MFGEAGGMLQTPRRYRLWEGFRPRQFPEVFEESSHMIELSFEKDLHENANENRSEVQWPPIRLIKKSTSGKCWRRCGEKGAFLHC